MSSRRRFRGVKRLVEVRLNRVHGLIAWLRCIGYAGILEHAEKSAEEARGHRAARSRGLCHRHVMTFEGDTKRAIEQLERAIAAARATGKRQLVCMGSSEPPRSRSHHRPRARYPRRDRRTSPHAEKPPNQTTDGSNGCEYWEAGHVIASFTIDRGITGGPATVDDLHQLVEGMSGHHTSIPNLGDAAALIGNRVSAVLFVVAKGWTMQVVADPSAEQPLAQVAITRL